MSTLSCHIYEGHTDQNAPLLSGKYTVDYLHISPNCQYILSHIPKSHGSPKTNSTVLKKRPQRTLSKKLIQIKTPFLREQRSKYTSDARYGIYLIMIPNEREFYELQVLLIVVNRP